MDWQSSKKGDHNPGKFYKVFKKTVLHVKFINTWDVGGLGYGVFGYLYYNPAEIHKAGFSLALLPFSEG